MRKRFVVIGLGGYTEGERVLRWLRHPSMSYARIARKLGFRYHTVFSIASRSGVRRRPAPYYKAPEGR